MPKRFQALGKARRRAPCAGALSAGSLCFLLLGIGAASTRAAEPSVLDLGAMDKSVDPCADFYTYSCGGWLKQNPIPPDRASWSAYSKLQDETLTQLKQILEQASRSAVERAPAVQKIGDYYAACMDEAAIEKRGLAPLAERLAEVEALASKQAIAGWLGRSLPAAPSALLFTYSSAQDYKHASDEIAEN